MTTIYWIEVYCVVDVMIKTKENKIDYFNTKAKSKYLVTQKLIEKLILNLFFISSSVKLLSKKWRHAVILISLTRLLS